jgi:peptidoglycan/xylan/chitin deacetylase (PgdA/CDA1 family)
MKPLQLKYNFSTLTALVLLFSCLCFIPSEGKTNPAGSATAGVPILLYHRFGPVVSDTMTVTTPVFESHLQYLRDQGYTIIPLKLLVDHCLGKQPSLPARPVVVVVDDAHKSVYTDMIPLVTRYQFPMTLFVYPSAISNASYAMTWGQLREVGKTGRVDFQSHTYWHPNFRIDKKKLAPAEYESSVQNQLQKSKRVLEKELNVKVDLLAWPFGIYDDHLMKRARDAGYRAAFSIERRHASASDNIMALPRYLLNDKDRVKEFGRIVANPSQG